MPFVKSVPIEPTCVHPEHKPPSHVVLKPGLHTWECPGCGKQQTMWVPEVTL